MMTAQTAISRMLGWAEGRGMLNCQSAEGPIPCAAMIPPTAPVGFFGPAFPSWSERSALDKASVIALMAGGGATGLFLAKKVGNEGPLGTALFTGIGLFAPVVLAMVLKGRG